MRKDFSWLSRGLILSVMMLFFFVQAVSAQETASTVPAVIPEDLPEGLVVTPTIIDEETKKREIFDYVITVKNNYRHKIDFYTFVNDINVSEGRQEFLGPSGLDRQTSLASWITIKRAGTELMAGEQVEIPLNVKVGQDATPGKRYAVISFVASSDRSQAESTAMSGGGATVNLNYDIKEEIVEKAALSNFLPKRNVFIKPPVQFGFTIENSGNRDLLPVGKLFIYDRRNREVAELPLFQGADSIAPGSQQDFTIEDNSLTKIGKYKAHLEIEYGNIDTRDLQDTIYFWVIPLVWLIAIFAILFVVLLLLTIIIFKRTYHHSQPLPEQFEREKEHVINLRK